MAIPELERLEKEKARALARLQAHDGEFTPAPGVPAVRYEAIRELVPTDKPTAMVQFALGREGSVAFILCRDAATEILPVRLPGLRAEVAWELAGQWLREYARCRQLPFVAFARQWDVLMERLLAQLHKLALEPVLQGLPQGIERLLFSPHQVLHLFPLHACRLSCGRRLADAYELVYTPSLSLLHRCANRKRDGQGDFAVVENPTGDLTFTAAECESVSRRLARLQKPARLPGGRATHDSVVAAALRSRLFHYSGHAVFNGQDPLESKLILSSEPLTLRELFTRRVLLPQNELTILNGCECALALPDLLDDFHNFTTGFLFAGAPCVVSTLWAIPDLPSALLMDHFHAQWLAGAAPAAALRAAVDWLRPLHAGEELDSVMAEFTQHLPKPLAKKCREQAASYVREFGETPFASPVHWAAFTCNGLGYARPQAA
jgi:CHAT domain-containing protein